MAPQRGAEGAPPEPSHAAAAATLRVVVPYALFAGLWILFSDKLLETLTHDAAAFARLSIYKGWAFVLVTSVLLAWLMRGQLRLRQRAFARLEERVAERTRELSEARRFMEAILDNVPDPVFWKDDQLRYLGCNRWYEQVFAVERAQLVGKTVLDLEYLPQAERRRYHDEQRRLLAEGTTLRREAVMTFADGRPHHTLFSVGGFRREDGSAGGVVAVFTDITTLKETQAALAEAKRAAESADRLKSAFLATMSHELRTPLNSIIGFTSILLQGLAGPLNDEQRKQLGMVQNSSRHLLALINDVLDISKIEAGQLKVSRAAFDLRPVLERAVSALRPMADTKRLSLRAEISPEVGEMVSDERRVEQIALNLLNNALKFTAQGEVTMRARTESGRLLLSVADTGIGIKPEHMSILFEPFQQVDNALTRAHEGTGLGLAISRRLAALLGGEIRAESEWAKGSVFTLTLPVRRPAP